MVKRKWFNPPIVGHAYSIAKKKANLDIEENTLFFAGAFLTTERNEEAAGTAPPTIGVATTITTSEVD